MSGSPDPSHPPGGRVLTAGVVYLGLFLFAFTVPLASPAKEGIAKSIGVADVADTWPVFTCYFLSWLVVIPPLAYLADRFGRRAMLLVGSVTLTAGMLLFSTATSLPVACVAQFLNGAGAIILQIVGVAIVTDLYAEKRASALNLAIGLVGIVALFSPMLMGELLERGVPWSAVYLYSAVLPAAAFLVQLVSRFPAAGQAVPITGRDVGDLFRSPIFLLLIASMFVYGIVEQGIPTWSPDYLGRELGATDRQKGLVVSAYFVVMSLVRLVVGLFHLFESVPHPRMIVVCSALGAGCIAAGTLLHDATAATLFLAAAGGAIALIWPSIMTYAVQATGKPTTTVFGLVVGIGGALGVMLGSAGLPLLKSTAGLSYQQSIMAMAAPLVLLLTAFTGVMLAKHGRAPASPKNEPGPGPAEPVPEKVIS